MGGRGAKSGAVGSVAPTPAPAPAPAPKPQPKPTPKKSTVDQLNDEYKANASKVNTINHFTGSVLNTELGDIRGVYDNGYTDGDNPQLLKWQGQGVAPDKAAAFLASVHNNTDYADYKDKYGFYPGDYQKFSLRLGLNKPPTILSEKEFNDVVKKNNLQVLYRGEAGQSQVDRFMNAKYSHTGVGYYGDGFYFSQDKGVANWYAQDKGGTSGRVVKMALSPTAKCITHKDLKKAWNKAPKKLRDALTKQGANSGAGYKNSGEAQYAAMLGYNVVTNCGLGGNKHYALTRDAFIVCGTIKHKW